MEEPAFDLNVSLPQDDRFLGAGRDLAVHAAERAGCSRSDAESFGRVVEDVLRRCADQARGEHPTHLVLRSAAGEVEALISCDHAFDAVQADDRDISVAWARDGIRPICRVARRTHAR